MNRAQLPLSRQRLHEEIAAFAEAHGGTDLDLDEELERAGIEAIREEDRDAMPDGSGALISPSWKDKSKPISPSRKEEPH